MGGASVRAARGLAVGALLACLGACFPMGAGYRSMHEVDGEVVHSSPPPPSAYESYLRARLALSYEPPQLDVARQHIQRALRIDSRDPHLWATRAEIEERSGQTEQALASARRALSIRPGYPPAERVVARLEGGAVSASTDAGAEPLQP